MHTGDGSIVLHFKRKNDDAIEIVKRSCFVPNGIKAAPLFWTSTVNGLSKISLEKPVNP
ncbi:MAG: hypothetical protein RR764_10775 [Oscillospiraceae bacterium]